MLTIAGEAIFSVAQFATNKIRAQFDAKITWGEGGGVRV